MAEFIKIPKDFNSLHDLKDLVVNYELTEKFINALKDYQSAYLNNFLMDYDELLNYIPESQHNKYKIYIRNREKQKNYIGEKKPGVDKNGYLIESLAESLLDIDVSKQSKAYMVNTNKKIINVCFWNCIGEKKEVNKKKKSFFDSTITCDIKYNNKFDFTLEPETKILTFKTYYSYTANQAIGGIWINGRSRGYLTRESYIPYTINGYDIYNFCTRTNKYFGYIGCQEDERRPWQEIKSRY